MNASAERTMTTTKGHTFVTKYTDEEAMARLVQLAAPGGQLATSKFAADLIRNAGRLTANQMVWVHKLVVDSEIPRPQIPKVEVNLLKVVEMLQSAAETLQKPKIRLQVGDLQIHLSIAGPGAKVPGSINVAEPFTITNHRFFGRILKDGTFEASRDMIPQILDLLKELSQDPKKVVEAYGHLTGVCCFCGHKLTDDYSQLLGYGPVCAKNFGLEH